MSITLWKYNKTTGIWNQQRSCEDATAGEWLAIFQKDEPGETFKLSRRKPSGRPRDLESL